MENKDKGLYHKYVISKADGSKMDAEAQYFVLRVDMKGTMNDKETLAHRVACRKALETYAIEITESLPILSQELLSKLHSNAL